MKIYGYDTMYCNNPDVSQTYQEMTFIKFKDEEGNLVGDVIKALYRETDDDFVILDGPKAGSYTWEEVEEVKENGEPYEEIPEDARFCLTPKSCFAISLGDSHITCDGFELVDDRNFENAYMTLEKWFRDNGYITGDDGKTKDVDNPIKPKDLFCKVVRVFYPESTEDQRDVAWELFVYNMDFQGNLKPESDEEED